MRQKLSNTKAVMVIQRLQMLISAFGPYNKVSMYVRVISIYKYKIIKMQILLFKVRLIY